MLRSNSSYLHSRSGCRRWLRSCPGGCSQTSQFPWESSAYKGWLVVDYVSRESRAEVNGPIVSRVKENLIFSDYTGPYGYFALAVPNLSQVELITRWVNQLEGVRDAHSDALQDVVLNRKHYERWRASVNFGPEGEQVPALGTRTTSH
jgi:hypothetical protein